MGEKWEFTSYKLQLNIPLSCQIRQRKLIEQFRREHGERFKSSEDYKTMIVEWKSNYLDLKYIYKWVIAPVLTKDLDCKSLVDNKFIVDLFYRHDEDEHAIFQLFRSSIQQPYQDKRFKKIKHYNHPVKKTIDQQRDYTSQQLESVLSLPREMFLSCLQDVDGSDITITTEQPASLTITAEHTPIYIMGKYCKYSRILSQT